MNFSNLVSGSMGFLHLISAVIAMIAGMFVLLSTKGTSLHKKMGYLYAVSMVIMIATSFMIYNLFGKFGIFHWLSLLSITTLVAGMLPVMFKKGENYIIYHFQSMYWSVIGLYCAFVAETMVRMPKIIMTADGEPMLIFYKIVGYAVALTMFVAIVFYLKFKPDWMLRHKK